MALQTPFQYYNDTANWGEYQFTTLREIVNFMELESQDDDSLLKNTKRSKFLANAKQGIRLLSRSVANKVLSFQIQVPTTLYWALPQDYVGYVRISRFVDDTETGSVRLQPLDINNNIPTAVDYLQDHKYELLFDSEGNILQSEGMNAINKPYVKVRFTEQGGQSMTDTSKWSKYGEVKFDEERGIIVFSSDLSDQFVLIEYVSDGLENELKGEEVKVHKDLVHALQDYIFWQCIARKKTPTLGEKKLAENTWLASRHKAVLTRANIDLQSIMKLSRKKSMTP
jgi:hypothetical protein